MKKNKIAMICIVVFLVTLLCSGCRIAIDKFDNAQVRQRAETMLDALIREDPEAGYALVKDKCTKEEFLQSFSQMQTILEDVDSYSLKLLSIRTNKNYTNGETNETVNATYEMTTNKETIIVGIKTAGPAQELLSIHVVPYTETDYYYTGAIDRMTGATALQWIFLLSNLIAIGFTIYAVVDCCCHKIQKKALWILVLCVGFATVGATFSATGFRFNANASWLTAYSAWIQYGSGTNTIRLMIPVGTICYFSRRNALLRAGEKETAAETAQNAQPEQTTEE